VTGASGTTVAACLRPGGLELTDRLLEAAALPRGAAALDVGCGDGVSVAHLADRHDVRAVGLDVSCARVDEAARARPDLRFLTGRAQALPFADGSFDAVLCECVLSILRDRRRALHEAVRVLRPGGALLLSDLYVREGTESAPHGGAASLGRRDTVEALLSGAGLRVVSWSDESEALGRYLWDCAGSGAAASGPARMPRRAPATSRRLGYFTCVARRH
jgi:arsenite methyltransferase